MRQEGDPFAPSTAKNVGKVVLHVFIPEERRKNASYEFQTSYAAFFFQSSGFLLFFLFSPVPDCGIRFLQCLCLGLPDATLDLSDF